jgi:transcriptional regulator GlxA family with amidase domain
MIRVLTSDPSTGSDKRVLQCISYMRQHLSEPLQVATLAARAGTSPSHFFVLFKRFTGCSPIDYFIRLRMQRASYLLETGPLSVKDIAAMLGYEDPFYFSRVFKSVHRLAPSHYRAQRVFSSSKRSGTSENQ